MDFLNWENKNIETKRFIFEMDIDLNETQQKYILEIINRKLRDQLGIEYKLKKYFLDSRIIVIAERV